MNDRLKEVGDSYLLPPSYDAAVAPRPSSSASASAAGHSYAQHHAVARKPLPPPRPVTPLPSKSQSQGPAGPGAILKTDQELARQLQRQLDLEAEQAQSSGRPPLAVRTSIPHYSTDSTIYASPARIDTDDSGLSSIASSRPSAVSSNSSAASSFLQKGLREARHFAGGLIEHPFEHTKHFSVLRHSHGLVFYQGAFTSLAISVFSDASLPADRTYWLQNKGWSGKVGMGARALIGRNGSWLDVTPATRATAEQLKPDDERAWQRDIAKFLKKARGTGQEKHRLRETVILRIPIDAEDGYFRVVLCEGDRKKVLCPSPVFRILSTSTDPSSIRGASLSTLPLEIGAMIFSSTALNAATNMISPVTDTVQNAISPYTPGFWTQEGAAVAYDATGMADKVDATLEDANSRYDEMQETLFTPLGGEIPTSDDGPMPPYPIKFAATVGPGTGESGRKFSMPTANLTGVPQDVASRLQGYYFGWTRFKFSKPRKEPVTEAENPWQQAVISALPPDPSKVARINVAGPQKRIAAYLMNDFKGTTFFGAQLEIRIMGYIRAHDSASSGASASGREGAYGDEAAVLAAVNDVKIAQLSLDRPAWGPEPVVEHTKSGGMERVKTRYAHTRATASRQANRVPFHRAGLRTPFDSLKEKAIGNNGGIYVVR